MTVSLDRKDEDILYYIKKGKTNAYQVWSLMNKESNGHSIAYVNVHKRFKDLVNKGLLELIITKEINLHARKDYRISKKAKNELKQRALRLMEIID